MTARPLPLLLSLSVLWLRWRRPALLPLRLLLLLRLPLCLPLCLPLLLSLSVL